MVIVGEVKPQLEAATQRKRTEYFIGSGVNWLGRSWAEECTWAFELKRSNT